MPCPDPHYTLSIINHKTGEQLKVELVDLPFDSSPSQKTHPRGSAHLCRSLPRGSIPGARSYRVRVHPVR